MCAILMYRVFCHLVLGWCSLLLSISATYVSTHPVDCMQLRAMQTPPPTMMDLSGVVASCYSGQGYCGWVAAISRKGKTDSEWENYAKNSLNSFFSKGGLGFGGVRI